jgi:hypothetical protein
LIGEAQRAGATTLNSITTIENGSWAGDPAAPGRFVEALESGSVLYIPDLGFPIEEGERRFFESDFEHMNSKNVSWDPATGGVRGLKSSHPESNAEIASLGTMMARFAKFGEDLLASLLGEYSQRLTTARTSFRPIEIEGRIPKTVGSNDRLLHIDSFSSRPMANQRILRIFTNVNPGDRPRVWNVGEPFENVAERFAPRLRAPVPGQRAAWRLFGVTKSYRTLYDHYMLRMQMKMKADSEYQRSVPQTRVEFPPGSTWICFTDQVSHAVLSGRFLLEQTYYLPVEGMSRADRSPLRVLESLLDRPLV